MRTLALTALFVMAACGEDLPLAETSFDERGPLMQAGQNCMSCHIMGGEAAGKLWTAAGTVYPAADSDYRDGVAGASIILTDAMGKVVTLTSNEVGNFYTAEPLAFPYRVRLEYQGRTADMPIPLDSLGACAGCHAQVGRAGALGRIRVPAMASQ